MKNSSKIVRNLKNNCFNMDVYKYEYKEVHKPHKIKRPTNRRPWTGAEGGH